MRSQESAAGRGAYLGELTLTGRQLTADFFARRARDALWRDLTQRHGPGAGAGAGGAGAGAGASGRGGEPAALTVQGRLMSAATVTDSFIQRDLDVEAIFRCVWTPHYAPV